LQSVLLNVNGKWRFSHEVVLSVPALRGVTGNDGVSSTQQPPAPRVAHGTGCRERR
jgi:hypothetical protein